MRTLRIFISSPGDVGDERQRAIGVVERVQRWYRDRVTLSPVLWEHRPLSADADFQSGIDAVGSADVAVFVLWSRLGTPLADRFRLADDRLPTGTEWEFEQAIEAHARTGKPRILAYRRQGAPSLAVDAADAAQVEARAQWKALDEFWRRHFGSEDGRASRAFHAYSTPAEFGERFEKHLMALVEEAMRGAPGGVAARASTSVEAPYRGLLVYEYEHAPIFFGRTRAIQGLLRALREQAAAKRAFVLVLGMSGSGKSSLVRAGLLPLLTSPEVVEPGAGAGPVRRAVLRPGDGADPFESLAAALLQEAALGAPGRDPKAVADLARALRAGPEAAVAVVHRELSRFGPAEGPGAARLVVVVDQMEELFALDRVTPEVARAFARVIGALSRGGRTWVVATLRGDFYGRLADIPELMALKEGAGHFDLLPPSGAEIGEIIRQPAQAAGLSFGTDSRGTPLDSILEEAAGKSPGALPLLAFTLERLYEQRQEGTLTHGAYGVMGGLEGAIAARAGEVHRGLRPEARAAMGRVLGSLVDVATGEDGAVTRRRPSLATLTAAPEAKEVVDAFVRARLLVADWSGGGEAVLDVAHESLFHRWPELKEWIDRNRSLLQVRSHVAAQAAVWAQEGRDPARLIAEGKPLLDARGLLEAGAVAVEPGVREYVEASSRRARRRRRIRRVLAGVGVLALVAVFPIKARIEENQREAARTEALAKAESARTEAQQAESDYGKARERIAALRTDVEAGRSSVFGAYAPRADRAAFDAKEASLAAEEAKAERLVRSAREALEGAARFEAPWGGTSQKTHAAFASHFLARWKEAIVAKDTNRARLAEESVREHDIQVRHDAEIRGRGTLAVTVEPPSARVHLFRYESYETVRTSPPSPPVVRRLVPVPTNGVGRCKDGVWSDDFFPGDLCLVVTKVAPDSPTARAGFVPGDLVIRVNGQPCGDGLFVESVVAGGPADRAGVRPGDRIESLDGEVVEGEYEWLHSKVDDKSGREFVLVAAGKTVKGPHDKKIVDALGLSYATPAALVSNPVPSGGLLLVGLNVGERAEFTVGEGAASGLAVEVTAYPLILSRSNEVAGGLPIEMDPGSYLLVAEGEGFEQQRFPVVVPRGGRVDARVILRPAGSTPEGFVYVPPGPFVYGGDPDAFQSAPREEASLPGYMVARKEVTYGEWFEFVNDRATRDEIASARRPVYLPRDASSPSGYAKRRDDGTYEPDEAPETPVMGISWNDVKAYLAWRNRQAEGRGERWVYDLPQDREWEKAARGVDARAFPWGERFDFSLCVGLYSKGERLYAQVGGFEPRDESPYGVRDLGGSRWEWSGDEYKPGSGTYPLRGGSWGSTGATYFRSASRSVNVPSDVHAASGFRLVVRPRP